MNAAAGALVERITSPPIPTVDAARWRAAVTFPERPVPVAGSSPVPRDFNPFAWGTADDVGSSGRLARTSTDFIELAVGIEPLGLPTMLNGEISVTYGRAMCVGDVITSETRLVGYRVRSGRSGPIVLTELEDRWINQDGTPIKRQRQTLVRPVKAPDVPPPPAVTSRPAASATVAPELGGGPATRVLAPFRRHQTLEHWNRFAAVNDEYVPIHMDDEEARRVGLPGAIAMGTLQVSYVHAMIASAFDGRWALRAVSYRFLAPVLLGSVVTATGRLHRSTGPRAISVECIDGDARVLGRGLARFG